MISTRLGNKSIKIRCTKSQVIDIGQLKYIYRVGMRIVSQNKILSIIVEVEENVRLTKAAKSLFNRIEEKDNKIPRVIIVG